jgi:hypothetical protein
MVSSVRHFLLGALLSSVLTCLFAQIQSLHMLSLMPTSGPISGNTPVTILGSGFSSASTLCRFGQFISHSAVVINSSALVCHSPVSTILGFVPIKVSIDSGVTYTDHSLDFQYFGSVSLTSLEPNQGSALGGKPSQLHGLQACFLSVTSF